MRPELFWSAAPSANISPLIVLPYPTQVTAGQPGRQYQLQGVLYLLHQAAWLQL
jgi:hypothetical protein